jgi:hypothetical protein
MFEGKDLKAKEELFRKIFAKGDTPPATLALIIKQLFSDNERIYMWDRSTLR